jgi:CHAD domain-containing protein
MAYHQLIKHYAEVQSDFNKFFEKVRKHQGRGDIHQLRISVKKLRSIWTVVDMTDGGGADKRAYFDLVGNLFREAGFVREAQVNRKLIKRHKQQYLAAFAEHLKQVEANHVESMLKTLEEFDNTASKHLEKLMVKTLHALEEKQGRDAMTAYISSELDSARHQLSFPKEKRDLHMIRKHIRNVNTQLAILNRFHPNADTRQLKNIIKPFVIGLGDWHDLVVLLDYLSAYADQMDSGRSKTYLEGFIRRLAARQTALEERLFSQLRRHL